MQVIFKKGEKKLLKGLKIKYFQFIMMSVRNLERKMKRMKKMKKKNKKNKKNKMKNKKKNKKTKKEESEESKFLKYIENKSEGISYFWFNYYFNFAKPSDLAKNKKFAIKVKRKMMILQKRSRTDEVN